MTVYMEVTQDKYELPLAVADSMTELAKLRRVHRATISHSMRKKRKKSHAKYVRVEVDEEGADSEAGEDI